MFKIFVIWACITSIFLKFYPITLRQTLFYLRQNTDINIAPLLLFQNERFQKVEMQLDTKITFLKHRMSDFSLIV